MKEYSYGVCPYVIYDDIVYILVSQSSKDSLYGFVKGKIENGETLKECAVREFREETNIFLEKEYLENMFSQKNPKKDIGIYLIDTYGINFVIEEKLNKELYSIEFKELNYDLYLEFEKNQKKILNDLSLYFKNIQKFNLKDKFKKEEYGIKCFY